ncbi:MAG: hypothetical protein AMXMBFR84_04480 [Candidatus Hydrogenedentota bacterium]
MGHAPHPNVVFVCEGSKDSGFGHVSRCLALAEAFVDLGYSASFQGSYEDGADRLLQDAEMPFATTPGETKQNRFRAAREILGKTRPFAIVADDYEMSRDDLAGFNAIAPTLFFDDLNSLPDYPCAAVLNPSTGVDTSQYASTGSALILGAEYLPVRKSLRHARVTKAPLEGPPERVLIAIGGADKWNLTLRSAQALLHVAPALSVHVVVGTSYRDSAQLSGVLARFEGECRLIGQVPSLADELLWADVAVCGGGMTKYEAAYIGVPPIVVSKTLEEARETVRFAADGFGFDLGYGPDLSDASLAASLEKVLAEPEALKAVSGRCFAAFPDDPTVDAVQAFLRAIS